MRALVHSLAPLVHTNGAIQGVLIWVVRKLPGRGVAHTTAHATVRKCFATQVVPKPKDRPQKLQTVSLKLVDSDGKPVNPTTAGHYFEIKHFVRITCKLLGCTRIKLYLPVVIAHKDAKPFEYAPSSSDKAKTKPAMTPVPVSPEHSDDDKPVAPDSIVLDARQVVKEDTITSATPVADSITLDTPDGVAEDVVASGLLMHPMTMS
ncbi:hypothetical protein FI667_g13729, partial [Globisporangium splendens]